MHLYGKVQLENKKKRTIIYKKFTIPLTGNSWAQEAVN